MLHSGVLTQPCCVVASLVFGFPKMRNRRRKQAILSSPLLFVVVHQEIRAYGFCAELTQHGGYLASMVTGMVDYVDHLLPERITRGSASGGLSRRDRLQKQPLRQGFKPSSMTGEEEHIGPEVAT